MKFLNAFTVTLFVLLCAWYTLRDINTYIALGERLPFELMVVSASATLLAVWGVTVAIYSMIKRAGMTA